MSSTKMLSVLALASFLGISGVVAIPSYADPAYAAVAPADHAPDPLWKAPREGYIADYEKVELTENERQVIAKAVENYGAIYSDRVHILMSRSQVGGLPEDPSSDCVGYPVKAPLTDYVYHAPMYLDPSAPNSNPELTARNIVDSTTKLFGSNDRDDYDYNNSWRCDFLPTDHSEGNVAIGSSRFYSLNLQGKTVAEVTRKNDSRATGMQPGVYVYRDRRGAVDSVLVVRPGPKFGLRFEGFDGVPGSPSWNPQIMSLFEDSVPWIRYNAFVQKAGGAETALGNSLTVEALNTKVQEALQSFALGDTIRVEVDATSIPEEYVMFYRAMFDMQSGSGESRTLNESLKFESYQIAYGNDSLLARATKTPQVTVTRNISDGDRINPMFYKRNFKQGIPVSLFKLNHSLKNYSYEEIKSPIPERAPTITAYWLSERSRAKAAPTPGPGSSYLDQIGGLFQPQPRPDYGPRGFLAEAKTKQDADFIVKSITEDRILGDPIDLTNRQDPIPIPTISDGFGENARLLVQYDYGNFSVFAGQNVQIEERHDTLHRAMGVEHSARVEGCSADEVCAGSHKVTLPEGVDPHSLVIDTPKNGTDPFITWNPDNQTLNWVNKGRVDSDKWANVVFFKKDNLKKSVYYAEILINGQPKLKKVDEQLNRIDLQVGDTVNIPILKWCEHCTPEDLSAKSGLMMLNMVDYLASRGVNVSWGTQDDPYIRLIGKVEKPVEQYPDVDDKSSFRIITGGVNGDFQFDIRFKDNECDPSTWGFRGPGEGVGLPDYDPIDVPIGDMVMGKAMTVAAGDSETDHAVADRQVPEHCNADDGNDAPPGDTSTEQPDPGPGDGGTESPSIPQPEPSIPGKKPPVDPVVPQPPVPLPQPVPQPAPVPAPSKPKPVPSEQLSPKPPLTDDEVGKIVGLPDWDTLYGESRHHTTTNTFRAIFKDKKASTVFVVRDNNPTDALGALSYAVANDIPILQTNPDVLSHKTKDYLDDLVEPNARVIILGGHEAVRPGVEAELKHLGYNVERFGGETRVETFKKFLAYTGYPALKAPTYELDDATVLDSALTRRGISFETGGALSEKKPITHTYRPGDRVTALYYASVKSLRTEAARADK